MAGLRASVLGNTVQDWKPQILAALDKPVFDSAA